MLARTRVRALRVLLRPFERCVRFAIQIYSGDCTIPRWPSLQTEFSAWVQSAHSKLHLTVPPVATVALQPALVARAVIGHLLAAEPARRPRHEELGGDLPVAMRQYFLSAELPFPPIFRLYAWPYPSSRTVIGRGIGHYDTRGGEPIVADTIKFFPVAFAIVGVEANMPTIPAAQIFPGERR